MPIISWSANLDGQPYTINLDHGMFSGKRIIQVNGINVHRASKFFDVGTSEHPFQIGTHNGKITIHTIGWDITYKLYVDEMLQETQKFTQWQIFKTIPVWLWLFVVILAFISISAWDAAYRITGRLLTPFSIIVAIAYVGFFIGMWIVSSERKRSLWLRVLLCITLTLAYGIFIVFSGCVCVGLIQR
jgi:hypothetical protein